MKYMKWTAERDEELLALVRQKPACSRTTWKSVDHRTWTEISSVLGGNPNSVRLQYERRVGRRRAPVRRTISGTNTQHKIVLCDNEEKILEFQKMQDEIKSLKAKLTRAGLDHTGELGGSGLNRDEATALCEAELALQARRLQRARTGETSKEQGSCGVLQGYHPHYMGTI